MGDHSVFVLHSSFGARSAKFVPVPSHFQIVFCTLNPSSSEEHPHSHGCTKASIVDGVLGSFIGLALDGDDWTLGMLDAELAHRAHENPLKWPEASTSHN